MRCFTLVTMSLMLTLAPLQACSRAPFTSGGPLGSAARSGAQRPGLAGPAARARLAARTTGVVITFAKPVLRPLPDKATDPEAAAERTAIVIQANREGAPVPRLRLRLQAGFVERSGGHLHDEARRPVGAFYGAQPLGRDTVVTTDGSGQVRLSYRASGIGGVDLVTASSDDGLTGQAELPIAYDLRPLPQPGPDDHFELVGQTADHPDNHNGTVGSQALMLRLADAHFKLLGTNFKINDQSIPSGGPFDLGPAYGVPYWTLGSKHLNHRQGNSTDVKSGTRQWREAIKRLGGSVFVEASHWHITTMAEAP